MPLLVDIYSFGFQASGIPKDPSENKGGHVFDCRCLPNPGRLDEYKRLTGLDASVKEWLANYEEVLQLAKTCTLLVEQSIQAYLKRDFDRLMVAFGCTGGQHRSVYLSEWLKSYLAPRSDIRVQVTHTEKKNWASQ